MITQICAGFFETYGLLLIMIALIALMLVFSSTKRKKEAKMAEEFMNNLKVGDKIKTYSGIYGTILSLKETPNGKIAVIETGEKNNKTTMTIDLFAIYSVVAPTQNANAQGIEKMPESDSEKDSVEAKNDSEAKNEKAEAEEIEEVKTEENAIVEEKLEKENEKSEIAKISKKEKESKKKESKKKETK